MRELGDVDSDVLEPLLARHGARADALIEVLNAVQQHNGYLSAPMLRLVAGRLKLPLSRVQGTASFYHLFRLSPPHAHTCWLCLGTACYIKGGLQLMDVLRMAITQMPWAALDLELGVVRCIGSCCDAPLVVVDGVVWNQQQEQSLLARLLELGE